MHAYVPVTSTTVTWVSVQSMSGTACMHRMYVSMYASAYATCRALIQANCAEP